MKKIAALALVIALIVGLTACGNQMLLDTVYTFDTAIIKMPDGEVLTVEIEKWSDYEDGDQLQIIAKDGTVYLVHSTNCVLMRKAK